eukprot:Amastigsp_a174783_217.p3 type:complete len:146 gc:universal Amastigsp_a174783_217:56-493(+)
MRPLRPLSPRISACLPSSVPSRVHGARQRAGATGTAQRLSRARLEKPRIVDKLGKVLQNDFLGRRVNQVAVLVEDRTRERVDTRLRARKNVRPEKHRRAANVRLSTDSAHSSASTNKVHGLGTHHMSLLPGSGAREPVDRVLGGS